MEVSGDVADLVVKESIEATEAAVKLAGSGIKNVAALLLALAQQDYKVTGQTTAKRLAKDPNPPTVTPLKKEDLQRFKGLAKEYGLLYVIPKKRGEDSGILNVISTETYAAKLNAIYQVMGYPVPGREKQEEQGAKKVPARARQENSSIGRGSGLIPSQTRESTDPQEQKLSVKKKLAALEAMSRQGPAKPERTKIHER